MLPVFAQFASVMFFLAGLGVLNSLWLPVLDISYELQNWGMVAEVPKDILRWFLDLAGLPSFWPVTIFFIGGGILVFLLGTYAWLTARAQGKGVADRLVYRLSRHPQYLGWILWTYGAYLLLQRGLYPKRSWGIGSSLPWLISTMVIIGVAMMEELNMRNRHGDAYESYRRSAPFLLPVPRVVERVFAAPFRFMSGKEQPTRRREVVAVVGFYTALLIAISALFYGGGLEGTMQRLASPNARSERAEALAQEIREEPDWRRQYRLAGQLVPLGDAAVDPLLEFLVGDHQGLRVLAAETLANIPSERAVPALCDALSDPDENLRWRACEALGAIGSSDAVPSLVPLLTDSVDFVRGTALQQLATLRATEVLEWAPAFLSDQDNRTRVAGISALGALGSPEGIPMLGPCLADESDWVREEAVVALLRIGSPQAVRMLTELLTEEDDYEVRIYAEEAVRRLREG
jgi:HEAT repeat protein/protein-S-isoprenylcysteine O-methyltransferase Ste14